MSSRYFSSMDLGAKNASLIFLGEKIDPDDGEAAPVTATVRVIGSAKKSEAMKIAEMLRLIGTTAELVLYKLTPLGLKRVRELMVSTKLEDAPYIFEFTVPSRDSILFVVKRKKNKVIAKRSMSILEFKAFIAETFRLYEIAHPPVTYMASIGDSIFLYVPATRHGNKLMIYRRSVEGKACADDKQLCYYNRGNVLVREFLSLCYATKKAISDGKTFTIGKSWNVHANTPTQIESGETDHPVKVNYQSSYDRDRNVLSFGICEFDEVVFTVNMEPLTAPINMVDQLLDFLNNILTMQALDGEI